MYVQAKKWTAQNDLMPGCASFRVFGTLEVGHPGIVPTLVKRDIQDKSFALALELKLEKLEGAFIQVVTEKPVIFEMPGDHSNIPKVDIYHDGQLLSTITEILVTH